MEPIYVVEYSDRDREDMDGEELQYAIDYYYECKKPKKNAREVDEDSDEDESYQPSLQVTTIPFIPKQ